MITLPTTDQLRSWDLDPAWSTTSDVASHDGEVHRWHMLDSARGTDFTGSNTTVVCVHGNPTWAYSWATFLRAFGNVHRVVAVDQLGMGYSDRVANRTYVDRIADLDDIINSLDIADSDTLVLAAHDWGGAIAMGWAVDHVDRLGAMVLCNTGIAVPQGRSSPAIIRLAASRPLRDLVCRRTNTFVEGTVRLSGSKITAADREAFRAPYGSKELRAAISDFVGDIPLQPGGDHPTEQPLADVAARLHTIGVPVLLPWGTADPVFNDDFAADLADRLPNAELHRFPKANHLVMAEADVAGLVGPWLADLADSRETVPAATSDVPNRTPLWAALDDRRDDTSVAFVDMATRLQLTWNELAERIDHVAAELHRRGVQRGDRVAMLVPPGLDLIAAVYGVWRAGGVTVIADRGLGLAGLGSAIRGSRPRWVVGPSRALTAARTLRWAPRAERIDVSELFVARTGELPDVPGSDDPAAVLFTSGATGPAKGVRYLHRQLEAQREALRTTYDIGPDDRLVAAFAPFALYGPALGITTALPACDVTKPASLTAALLNDACASIDATMAFGSPAALANVVDTVAGRDTAAMASLRTVMSAGAPVPAEILRSMSSLCPEASLHTPYGMTEVLPVADIDLDDIEAALTDDPTGGVCVGPPVDGCQVVIAPLGFDPAMLPPPIPTGQTGEILVHSPWVSDGYAGLWGTQRAARPRDEHGTTWHRSGDVGHIDVHGRLWVEGRAVHVIHAGDGPITSVPVERTVESELGLRRVAAVGVGPVGAQQLVIVIEDVVGTDGLASADLAGRVRSVVEAPVAAVLTRRSIPVDIRHNSKVDRAAVAAWADDVLAGRRLRRRRR